jgi:alanyl-tRNA synthetase
MNSREARQTFLEFFAQRDHRVVPSSPLVLPGDPTLLFANAGMNQFKDVFTGKERRDYTRAASSQKCLRVSGKHNDLEMVGFTARHQTLFEMLGNFSFGDYFKREAIAYAWELLTRVYAIPEDRLWVTVFGGSETVPPDDEALALWRDEIGVPAGRILRRGEQDNFWRMGEVGPCGPCSEIHYDLGADLASGGADSTPATDERRYVEIWNLVFMQYVSQANGRLVPLPAPSIDTGMGLERLVSVLQGRRSNYDTDLFAPVLAAAARRAGVEYGRDERRDVSLRVIADHARALCFLVADGVIPANDKRGYVLRRLVRRAIRHGRKLGIGEPFLHEITPAVIDSLGRVYPELLAARQAILEVGRLEEERFSETLAAGLETLERKFEELAREPAPARLPGAELFRLYDTYGFPIELARDIARERGVELDEAGFEEAMERQRARARASWRGGEDALGSVAAYRELAVPPIRFRGYESTVVEGATVVAALDGGRPVGVLAAGGEGELVLDETPFYAEAGGQVGDRGWLASPEGRAEVLDTWRPAASLIVHRVRMVEGRIPLGGAVVAEVDVARRNAVRRNHTATHLLHAALREVVGTHVKQAGSLVAADRLRFDFSHFSGLSDRALGDVESLVNQKVLEDSAVETEVADLDVALARGAMALFGEKYGDRVRVVTMGDGFSVELCGGTHCERTGEVGLFKLTEERGIASGVRRVEAVTGQASLETFRRYQDTVRALERLLSAGRLGIVAEVERRLEAVRALERELAQRRVREEIEAIARRAQNPQLVGGIKVLTERADALSPKELRELADSLRRKLGSGVVVLGRAEGARASLLVAVTQDLVARLPAVELVRSLAKIIGGGGGGRPDLAEAGGKDAARLDEALQATLREVARRVESAG